MLSYYIYEKEDILFHLQYAIANNALIQGPFQALIEALFQAFISQNTKMAVLERRRFGPVLGPQFPNRFTAYLHVLTRSVRWRSLSIYYTIYYIQVVCTLVYPYTYGCIAGEHTRRIDVIRRRMRVSLHRIPPYYLLILSVGMLPTQEHIAYVMLLSLLQTQEYSQLLTRRVCTCCVSLRVHCTTSIYYIHQENRRCPTVYHQWYWVYLLLNHLANGLRRSV